MRAGDLDRELTIQDQVRTKNPIGEYEVEWVNIIEDEPCTYQALTGRENYESAQLVAGADSRFRIRYRRDVFPRQRVLFEGIIYDIRSVTDGAGRREYTEIFAHRKDNAQLAGGANGS